jgi:glutathione S-transferase
MQLISLPASPFAARVRIAIYAKGLAIDLLRPPLGWPRNPQFRDVCPTGRVPVLLHDGGAIWESSVLLEFLEDRFPNSPSLLPIDLVDRARARLLVRHADAYLMPPMVALAEPHIGSAESRAAMNALLDGIVVLNGLVPATQYAVGKQLSLGDCALAPALFAARVTGERFGVDPIEAAPAIAAYAGFVRRDEHVARVLDEMEDGLRSLERGD